MPQAQCNSLQLGNTNCPRSKPEPALQAAASYIYCSTDDNYTSCTVYKEEHWDMFNFRIV